MDTAKLLEQFNADPAAVKAYSALTQAGGRVYIVGGAIRDAVLGKTPKDIDLMVTGLPKEQVQSILESVKGNVTFAGENFGVFHYTTGGSTVEIALPRIETSTGSGHKDFDVKVDHTLPVESDLGRRDFTANAMAYDIANGELVDPFGGADDIHSGTLRLINEQAFQEDPLRIVRALVAYSKHGLEPDQFTLDQMQQQASAIAHLPGERIQEELTKLFSGDDPALALQLAHETGVLDYICPELSEAMGFDQHNRYHDLDVGLHSLAVLDHMATLTDDPDLRLAAVLHDIGKPDSFWQDDQGNGHFYAHPDRPDTVNHEDLGADIAYAFMKRLKYSNERINRVVTLVRNHMFPPLQSESAARKYLNRLNGDVQMGQDLLMLRASDASGKSTGEMSVYDQERHADNQKYLQAVIDKEQAFGLKNLAIGGADLIAIGVPQGPEIGKILKDLLDQVIEDPTLNDRETLLQLAEERMATI